MSLQTLKDQKGFTIVELLIVIVIIGILAAITIVAYNGIQNRGKASSAQSLANTVVKKLEAWNSIQGSYPTYCQFVTNSVNPTIASGTVPTAGAGLGTTNPCVAGSTAGPKEAKIDDPTGVTAVSSYVTSGTGTSTVYLSDISSSGIRVNYWNYTASSPGLTTSTTTPPSPKAGNP